MRPLRYNEIFNVDTLNIFTDASIKKTSNETLGCPGAVAIRTLENGDTTFLDQYVYVERQATNNSSEIRAINLGIALALNHRHNFKTINLFSDSRICIEGLREWIFNWMKCINNGVMISSSGKPVGNQEIFISIVNTIINQNLNINFYHQKGHVSSSADSISNAIRVFGEVNKMLPDVGLMKCLSDYNNYIDIRTKDVLNSYVPTPILNILEEPIQHRLDNIDLNKYRSLIKDNPITTNSNRRSFFD